MDLIKIITEEFQNIEASGKLREIVKKNVSECVEDIVSTFFKWGGKAKESLEKSLEDKLGINLENVKLDQYSKIVGEVVQETLNSSAIQANREVIEQKVKDITGILDKKEWKLSEIIEKYTYFIDKSYDGEMDDQVGECSLFVSDNKQHISFDKEKKDYCHQCHARLFIGSEGRLTGVTLDDKPFSPFYQEFTWGFEKFMFQLYCNNVKIIVDEGDCELYYYREDYD